MHGCQGVCVVAGEASMVTGGQAWLWGGVCDCGGRVPRRHAWWGVGACVAMGLAWRRACMARMPPPGQILRLRHTVSERTVRILLECTLFFRDTHSHNIMYCVVGYQECYCRPLFQFPKSISPSLLTKKIANPEINLYQELAMSPKK